jgi:hypothetical protein
VTATLRIIHDPVAASTAEAVRRMAAVAPHLVLARRTLEALAHELGGVGRAARFLLSVVEANDRPLAVNCPTQTGSCTAFVAPKDWTQERLTGWAAGAAVSGLADLFGPVERISTPKRGPRSHPRQRRRGRGRRWGPPGCPRRPAALSREAERNRNGGPDPDAQGRRGTRPRGGRPRFLTLRKG